MMATPSLQGLRVLVTRPAAQAESLSQMLQARGAEVWRLPLQAIEPVRHGALVARALDAARDAQWWIFTSVNAVHYAAQLAPPPWPPTIAVGHATAVALEKRGQTPRLPRDAYSSEGVLRMPELTQVAGSRIAIVTGEDGLTTMADTLRARGAELRSIAVYRRVALPLAAEAVDAALRRCEVVLITSGEAFAHLVAHLDASQLALLAERQLVVPSRRVLEEATRLGCRHAPLLPGQVADDAYVRCLERWRAAEATST